MTSEEAQELLKVWQHNPMLPTELGNAIGLAIEALEKQIPKKPVLKKHENRVPEEQDEYYCPNCDEWITWDFKWKWCAMCGQAIDWSDEE